jgi:hypothetical protein
MRPGGAAVTGALGEINQTGVGRATAKAGGVSGVRLPSRSPNLNAHAERFVGSIRRECLNRVIPLGERHLLQLGA